MKLNFPEASVVVEDSHTVAGRLGRQRGSCCHGLSLCNKAFQSNGFHFAHQHIVWAGFRRGTHLCSTWYHLRWLEAGVWLSQGSLTHLSGVHAGRRLTRQDAYTRPFQAARGFLTTWQLVLRRSTPRESARWKLLVSWPRVSLVSPLPTPAC